MTGPRYMLLKRCFDLFVASVTLILMSPLLLVAVIAIMCESHGNPFYRQSRVGKHGRDFTFYKLRTMVPNAENIGDGLTLNEGDPRITRVGLLLRRLSLDEIPNLFCVIKGDMSVVGPRPTVRVQVDKYTDHQRQRLNVKPGITGWAQIKGRASLPWSERIELDIWYVKNCSLVADIWILIQTLRVVVTGHGLYKGETGGWQEPKPQSLKTKVTK